MNRDKKKILNKDNPVITANIFSKLSFWWLKDLFVLGYKRSIEEEDLYKNKSNLNSEQITEKFIKQWNHELEQKKPSVLRMLFKLYGIPVIFWGLVFSIGETVCRVVQPLCLGGFVSYFAPGQTTITRDDALMYAMGIILSSAFSILTFHPFILWIFEVGLRIRLGSAGLLYRKTLRLSKSATYEGLNGKVINIMSNDLSRFELALAFLHDIWKGPMEALLFSYFIYNEIGISAIIGMAFLLSFIPLQAWIGKKAAQYRLKTAKRTDFRVKIMNEIISGIQVIKMYAWEKSFATMVDKIRKKEISAIRGTQYIRAALVSFAMISKTSVFLSLVSYVYFGNVITARKVFIVSSYFNILNLSMVFFWPVALTTVAEGYISATRVQEFLLESEDKPNMSKENSNTEKDEKRSKNYRRKNMVIFEEKNGIKIEKNNIAHDEGKQLLKSKRIENINSTLPEIELINATAAWELLDKDKKTCGIVDINLKVEPGKLCAIVGQVGAGKSTILNVIIGELELDDGSIIVNGTLSYAAQEAWLYEGTVRNNIIFVDEYDEKRYNHVIKVCALEKDFELLPNRDLTIVGERGISLSGGQKARVSLARAIYKKADIYLLDDPLSAVDTHVGKHIFEKCIKEFLADKVCILVTHQLQYLKKVQQVVIINDGRIIAKGPYNTLHQLRDKTFLTQISLEEDGDRSEKGSENKAPVDMPDFDAVSLEDMDHRKEFQQTGAVSFKVYTDFIKAVENKFFITFVCIFCILGQIANSSVEYFVSQWVNWEESIISTTKNEILDKDINTTDIYTTTASETLVDQVAAERQQYIYIYTIIISTAIVIFLSRTFAFFKMCLMASVNLHDKLFKGITRATMYFFNNNPSGRILNRFSKDINGIDTSIPPALKDCIEFYFELTAVMVLVAIVNYWLLIPTVIMAILFYGIRLIYINTGRSVKRIDSLTRSPIYSHTNATLQGLSTVRAFKAQAILEKEFHEYQNLNTSAWYLFITTTRAFAVWLDWICMVYIIVVTLSFILLPNDQMGGNVGLAVLQCINLIGMCQWGMRQTAEIENQMTSVERVLEYANLPSEPPLESEEIYRPAKDWPQRGMIVFRGLSLKYSESGPYVLRNLNFEINANEKIGIVGRTGAGKSSTIQAIFRLAINEGTILIDNIDISTLGLHDLRKNISIIPQDPVLFSGSLRTNLDPFDERTDDEMWDALQQVELKVAVSLLVGGLDCKMSDGGSNFSMGQRQLVCLARAILRSNRILILDEATANVDPETDKLIQNTIRTKFQNCTVLTIAHRLHTIMDSDRVLVVNEGKVVEFDHAHELLKMPVGYFTQMVEQTGAITMTQLRKAALDSYNKIHESE